MSGLGWRPHYNRLVECDFCGQQTRGRIYEETRTKVRCGACDRVIASTVTLPDPPWNDGEPDAQAPGPITQDIDIAAKWRI